MSAEHAAVHTTLSVDSDRCRIELMNIRGVLMNYLASTSPTSPERRYVKQAETLIAAALVNMEESDGNA